MVVEEDRGPDRVEQELDAKEIEPGQAGGSPQARLRRAPDQPGSNRH